MCVAVPGCTIREAKFKLWNAAPVIVEDVVTVFGVEGREAKRRPLVPGERGVVAIRKSEFIVVCVLQAKGSSTRRFNFCAHTWPQVA